MTQRQTQCCMSIHRHAGSPCRRSACAPNPSRGRPARLGRHRAFAVHNPARDRRGAQPYRRSVGGCSPAGDRLENGAINQPCCWRQSQKVAISQRAHLPHQVTNPILTIANFDRLLESVELCHANLTIKEDQLLRSPRRTASGTVRERRQTRNTGRGMRARLCIAPHSIFRTSPKTAAAARIALSGARHRQRRASQRRRRNDWAWVILAGGMISVFSFLVLAMIVLIRLPHSVQQDHTNGGPQVPPCRRQSMRAANTLPMDAASASMSCSSMTVA